MMLPHSGGDAPDRDPANTMVVFGDWHGNTSWARYALGTVRTKHLANYYHVGDFGLWHLAPAPGIPARAWQNGRAYMQAVNDSLASNHATLNVVLGNHENYDALESLPTLKDQGVRAHPDYPNIRFLPRAHMMVDPDTGAHIATLGGAGSIDKAFRTPRVDWWEQENITFSDLEAFREKVAVHRESHGIQQFDLFLSHDAPKGIPLLDQRSGRGLPAQVTPDLLAELNLQRMLLREALDTAAPHTAVHGHWHFHHETIIDAVSVSGEDYTVRMIGLDMDGTSNNILCHQLG